MSNSICHAFVSCHKGCGFQSIQDAIDGAPSDESRYVIYVCNGIYHEKIMVHRNNITLLGESAEYTVICAATANGSINEKGDKFGTAGSRTVQVSGKGFCACHITIENRFDYITNQEKAANDPSKLIDTQAVALLIAQGADQAQFKNVKLLSYQDTLFLQDGRSYFENCTIAGTVDFIFGAGIGLFKGCNIVARNRQDIETGGVYGYLTAPATHIHQTFGLVFKDCRLTKEDGVPVNSYALGRPWHPTTSFHDGFYADPNALGHCAFIECDIDEHIFGWDKMHGWDKTKQRIWFYAEDARFWEFNNKGDGAVVVSKRPQLTEQMLNEYADEKLLAMWQPSFI